MCVLFMKVVVGEVRSPEGSCADIGLTHSHAPPLLLLLLKQTADRLCRALSASVLLDGVGLLLLLLLLLPLLFSGPRCCKQAHQLLPPASNSCRALNQWCHGCYVA
jgi:hypothetical protein